MTDPPRQPTSSLARMRTRANAFSRLLRILIAALVAAALWSTPGPVFAAEVDCAQLADSPEVWTGDGGDREDFSPPSEVVPPPLLPFWDQQDCATKAVDADIPGADGASTYAVHFVDVSYALFIDMLRAFEAEGWTILGTRWGIGESLRANDDLSVDEIAAVPDTSRVWVGPISLQREVTELQFDSTGAGAGADVSSITAKIFLQNTFGPQSATGTSIADPSVLSSLRTIQESIPNATQLVVVGAGALMLMLVVGYPGALLDSVITSRYARVSAWVKSRLRARPTSSAGHRGLTRGGAAPPGASLRTAAPTKAIPPWLVWPGFAAAAVIGGFVDPQFGVNGMSIRVFLTGLLSFALINVAGWMLVVLVFRRNKSESAPHITFRWESLLLVALTVLIARLLHFQPGVIFGLVAGLAFAIELTASREAFVVLLGTGFGLIIGLLGWVGFSLVAPVAAESPGNIVAVFVAEFFSGVTIEGISALPLAMLPLFALDGATLFAWKRWVWALAYIVGAAAFILVMVTIPDSWGKVDGDFARWMLLFASFGVLATAVWAINFAIARREERARSTPPNSAAK
ncbi:hypothetical protein ACPW96_00035 [Micromonospora sp. DT81.3]|uniref:hypothetical protein n=1 Tax=Micromonospora sp. DT81.3 TaxID=3416523 RepID=UPI003CFB2C7C